MIGTTLNLCRHRLHSVMTARQRVRGVDAGHPRQCEGKSCQQYKPAPAGGDGAASPGLKSVIEKQRNQLADDEKDGKSTEVAQLASLHARRRLSSSSDRTGSAAL